MEPVVDALPAGEIDRLEPLWAQLLTHHVQGAPHLEALSSAQGVDESWRLRRERYVEWLASPLARAFVAREADRVLGYAVVRLVESPGTTWQWGDRVGVLETLVVDDDARGAGIGRTLLQAARDHLAILGVEVMKVSVMAGNEDAERFYRREGAVDFVRTVVMPITAERPGD